MLHIGVIPARAGSVRFPGKNRAMLDGDQLWKRAHWTGWQGGLSRVIVNTDDPEIIREGGRFEYYERPTHLRDGRSYRIDDVIIEMVKTLGLQDDHIHLIQCTSPFIAASHIETGMIFLDDLDKDVDSVQLVTRVSNTHHAFSQRVIKNGRISFRYPEERSRHYNSQLKPEHYIFGGYVGFRASSLLRYGNIWGKKSMPIIGPPECAIDIDTPEDLGYAEWVLMKKRQEAGYD